MKWEFPGTIFQRYQLLVNSSIQFLWKLALLQWNKNFFRLVISEDCYYILLARTRLIKFLHSKSLHYNLVPGKASKVETETLVVVFEVDASPSTWSNLKTWYFSFWFKIKFVFLKYIFFSFLRFLLLTYIAIECSPRELWNHEHCLNSQMILGCNVQRTSRTFLCLELMKLSATKTPNIFYWNLGQRDWKHSPARWWFPSGCIWVQHHLWDSGRGGTRAPGRMLSVLLLVPWQLSGVQELRDVQVLLLQRVLRRRVSVWPLLQPTRRNQYVQKWRQMQVNQSFCLSQMF